jgi:hypothetical protein
MIDIAFSLSQEKLPIRVAPWGVTKSLIIDFFVKRTLLRLAGRRPLKIISTIEEDHTALMGRIPMADLLVGTPRPLHTTVVRTAVYAQWLRDNLPEGMKLEDFDDLVYLADRIIYNWATRRWKEVRIAAGVGIVARVLTLGIHFGVLYTAYQNHQNGFAGLILVAWILAIYGIVCLHPRRA